MYFHPQNTCSFAWSLVDGTVATGWVSLLVYLLRRLACHRWWCSKVHAVGGCYMLPLVAATWNSRKYLVWNLDCDGGLVGRIRNCWPATVLTVVDCSSCWTCSSERIGLLSIETDENDDNRKFWRRSMIDARRRTLPRVAIVLFIIEDMILLCLSLSLSSVMGKTLVIDYIYIHCNGRINQAMQCRTNTKVLWCVWHHFF